jgi:hypothetical protein
MFLTQVALLRVEGKPSEVLDAVRQATPESRHAFEEHYGPITCGRASSRKPYRPRSPDQFRRISSFLTLLRFAKVATLYPLDLPLQPIPDAGNSYEALYSSNQ